MQLTDLTEGLGLRRTSIRASQISMAAFARNTKHEVALEQSCRELGKGMILQNKEENRKIFTPQGMIAGNYINDRTIEDQGQSLGAGCSNAKASLHMPSHYYGNLPTDRYTKVKPSFGFRNWLRSRFNMSQPSTDVPPMDTGYATETGVQDTGRLIPAVTEAQATEIVMPSAPELRDTQNLMPSATEAQDTEPWVPAATEERGTEHLTPSATDAQDTEPLIPVATEAQDTETVMPTATEARDTEPLMPATNEVRATENSNVQNSPMFLSVMFFLLLYLMPVITPLVWNLTTPLSLFLIP